MPGPLRPAGTEKTFKLVYVFSAQKKRRFGQVPNRHIVQAGNGSRTRDIHLGKVALYH